MLIAMTVVRTVLALTLDSLMPRSPVGIPHYDPIQGLYLRGERDRGHDAQPDPERHVTWPVPSPQRVLEGVTAITRANAELAPANRAGR